MYTDLWQSKKVPGPVQPSRGLVHDRTKNCISSNSTSVTINSSLNPQSVYVLETSLLLYISRCIKSSLSTHSIDINSNEFHFTLAFQWHYYPYPHPTHQLTEPQILQMCMLWTVRLSIYAVLCTSNQANCKRLKLNSQVVSTYLQNERNLPYQLCTFNLWWPQWPVASAVVIVISLALYNYCNVELSP